MHAQGAMKSRASGRADHWIGQYPPPPNLETGKYEGWRVWNQENKKKRWDLLTCEGSPEGYGGPPHDRGERRIWWGASEWVTIESLPVNGMLHHPPNWKFCLQTRTRKVLNTWLMLTDDVLEATACEARAQTDPKANWVFLLKNQHYWSHHSLKCRYFIQHRFCLHLFWDIVTIAQRRCLSCFIECWATVTLHQSSRKRCPWNKLSLTSLSGNLQKQNRTPKQANFVTRKCEDSGFNLSELFDGKVCPK